MGWNIVYQFRRAQEEIDRYLRIIPLIVLIDTARVMWVLSSKEINFPYPLGLTLLHMVFSSVLCFILTKVLKFLKIALDQRERDLSMVVNSLALSINERDLQTATPDMCNASCISFSLVKLLQLSGYDAGVCTSRWPTSGKVPGGDHEYIDVVYSNNAGDSEHLLVDIDFRTHFEIARAVESYDRILDSLPVIYVGTFTKLKQYLQLMAEAAKPYLKQNSMPLPPWRSFAYLQSKWQSPYQRKFVPDEHSFTAISPAEHRKCAGHLKRLHSLLCLM